MSDKLRAPVDMSIRGVTMAKWRDRYLRAIEGDYVSRQSFFVPLYSVVSHKTEHHIEDLFDIRGTVTETKKPSATHDFRNALEAVLEFANKSILVVGAPGSGKTTLMEQAVLELARAAIKDPARPAPVYIPLRFLATSLMDLVATSLSTYGGPATTADGEKLVNDGLLIFIFDGLNEAPNPDVARRELRQFKTRWEASGMVFTGREHACWEDLKSDFQLRLNALRPDDVARFASQFAPDVPIAAFRAFRNLTSPLLVRLACLVLSQTPDATKMTEGDVYRIFGRRYTHRPDIPAEKIEQFAPLCHPALVALGVHQFKNAPAAVPKLALKWGEALEVVAASISGLPRAEQVQVGKQLLAHLVDWHVLRKTADHVEFVHQRFSEYYAAEGLLERFGRLPPDILKWQYLNKLVWEEPLCLAVSITDELEQQEALIDLSGSLDPIVGDHAMRCARTKFSFQQRESRMRSWSDGAWRAPYADAREESEPMENLEMDYGSDFTIRELLRMFDTDYVDPDYPVRMEVNETAAQALDSIFGTTRFAAECIWGRALAILRQGKTQYLEPPDKLTGSRSVFVSYASEDHELVAPYVEALRAAGLEPWFDRNDIRPGDSIPAKVEEEIENSSVMVVFHSAFYAQKHWGNEEWRVFLNRKLGGQIERRLIVYRLDQESQLPAFLASRLWRAGDSPFQFAAELADLVSTS